MTPPSRSKSTIEMSTVIAEEKKIPTITPARTSVWTGKPPAPAAMRYTAPPATKAPANAKTVSAERLEQPRSKPEHLGQHHPERGAARHAEHGGLGERVARQGLEADARDGEGAAGEDAPRRCAAGAGSAPRPRRPASPSRAA